MRRGWPGRGLAGLCFVIGVVVGMGQPPLPLQPLALLALAWLLHLLCKAPGPAAAFWMALAAGAGNFALSLNWIVNPFFVDPLTHGWMAPFALALMSLGLALFWAVAAALAAKARWRLPALVLALAAADLLRGHVFTGFPWSLFGHIPLGTPAEQLGALVGGYGMGLLVLALAALPVALRWFGGAAMLAAVLAAVFWGMSRQSIPDQGGTAAILRVVQPNIAQSIKWDPDVARQNFDRLLDLTVSPAKGPSPVLAVWPETSVPFLVREGEGAALVMGSLGLPVAAGFQRSDGNRVWNSLAIFGPGGTVEQAYDKIHLVPFGEYLPMGDLLYDLFGLNAFAAEEGFSYSTGTAAQLMDFGPGLGLARPLICYEAIFPEEVGTVHRPAWLLQVTNDAWFGTLTGPHQHFAQARLRAIEQGLPLVRASNTGISAVIDARGRVATDTNGEPAILGMGMAGVIDAPLPPALSMPPYARFGDWPLIALLIAGLILCFVVPGRAGKA
jgi:apolipoprotein N-acyltransferase